MCYILAQCPSCDTLDILEESQEDALIDQEVECASRCGAALEIVDDIDDL